MQQQPRLKLWKHQQLGMLLAGDPVEALATLPAICAQHPHEVPDAIHTLMWRAPVATLTALTTDSALYQVPPSVVAPAAVAQCQGTAKDSNSEVYKALRGYLESVISRGGQERNMHNMLVRVLCIGQDVQALDKCDATVC
jgi:hypothetical protein